MESAWWEDESELLDAALMMLADWDGAPAKPPPSRAREIEASAQQGPARKGVTVNRSRERQRQEKQQLQQLVGELESEVARLESRSAKRKRPGDIVSMWENVTRRQLHARRRAEALNATLRNLVKTQADAAQELIRAVQRAELTRQDLSSDVIFPVEHRFLSLSTAASDDELESRLSKMTLEWRAPFGSSNKFHHPIDELEFSESVVVRDDIYESVIDVRDCKAFPFPRKRVEDEVWQYFHSIRHIDDEFAIASQVNPVSNDTLAGGWQMSLRSKHLAGTVESRTRSRRRRNELGELIVATTVCGRVLPVNNGESETIEAVVFEDTWLRVLDAWEDQSKTPMTIVQHVRRTRIQFCGSSRPPQAQVENIKRLVAELDQLEMRSGQEIAERRLMLGPSNLMYNP